MVKMFGAVFNYLRCVRWQMCEQAFSHPNGNEAGLLVLLVWKKQNTHPLYRCLSLQRARPKGSFAVLYFLQHFTAMGSALEISWNHINSVTANNDTMNLLIINLLFLSHSQKKQVFYQKALLLSYCNKILFVGIKWQIVIFFAIPISNFAAIDLQNCTISLWS